MHIWLSAIHLYGTGRLTFIRIHEEQMLRFGITTVKRSMQSRKVALSLEACVYVHHALCRISLDIAHSLSYCAVHLCCKSASVFMTACASFSWNGDALGFLCFMGTFFWAPCKYHELPHHSIYMVFQSKVMNTMGPCPQNHVFCNYSFHNVKVASHGASPPAFQYVCIAVLCFRSRLIFDPLTSGPSVSEAANRTAGAKTAVGRDRRKSKTYLSCPRPQPIDPARTDLLVKV